MLPFLSLGVAMAAPPSEAPARLDLVSLVQLDGTPLPGDTIKGKAVLVVNVASYCGYTGQYDALQALSEARASDGLIVVGVPCNQFGGQEPGSNAEIKKFAEGKGAKFSLFSKEPDLPLKLQ